MALPSELIQALLVSGIARAGNIGLNKAMRVRKIDQAIMNLPNISSAEKTAISDFKMYLDLRYGGRSDEIELFFREIQNTGILTAMVEHSVIGTPIDNQFIETKNAFSKIYRSIMVNCTDHDDNKLFDKMIKSFDISIKNLCKDNNLAEIVTIMIKDLKNTIKENQNIEQKQDSILSPFENYDVLAGFFLKLSKVLNSQYRFIRVETNKGAKLIDLQRVYIPSKLILATDFTQNYQISDQLPTTPKKLADIKRREHEQDLVLTLEFGEIQNNMSRGVVLGDPGGGKSTLCQYICYTFAKEYSKIETNHNSEIKNSKIKDLKIPIRIILRHFEVARNKIPHLGIFDYICLEIKSIMSARDEECRYAVEYMLSLGKAYLAFDGLDEILNTSSRRDIVVMVSTFCDQYPLCPVIVTSRLVGYEDASLPDSFEKLYLKKFDESEIKKYVIKLLKVVGSLKKSDAEKEANKFMLQSSKTAQDLRQNPLLLGLMTVIFIMKGDIPASRPEIYQDCAIMMFEKWDQNRDIIADVPGGFELLDLFSKIAAKIYGNVELEEGVSTKWLGDFNKVYFEGQFESRAKSNDAAQKVTKFITGRSWVMSEFGTDVYKFTHRTFLEYFFARFQAESHETVRDLLYIVIEQVKDNKWDVIAQLSVQIKTYRNQTNGTKAVNIISDYIKHNINDEKIVAVARFGASILLYVTCPELSYGNMVRQIYNVAMIKSKDNRKISINLLAQCINCKNEMQGYLAEVISETIIQSINSDDMDEVVFVTAIVPSRSIHYLFSLDKIRILPDDISTKVRNKAKNIIRTRAEMNKFFAFIYVQWYREEFIYFFEKYNFLLAPKGEFLANKDLQYVDEGFIILSIAQDGSYSDSFTNGWLSNMETVGNLGEVDLVLSGKDRIAPAGGPAVLDSFWYGCLERAKNRPCALRGILKCFFISLKVRSKREIFKGPMRRVVISSDRGLRMTEAEFRTYVMQTIEKCEERGLDMSFWIVDEKVWHRS